MYLLVLPPLVQHFFVFDSEKNPTQTLQNHHCAFLVKWQSAPYISNLVPTPKMPTHQHLPMHHFVWHTNGIVGLAAILFVFAWYVILSQEMLPVKWETPVQMHEMFRFYQT